MSPHNVITITHGIPMLFLEKKSQKWSKGVRTSLGVANPDSCPGTGRHSEVGMRDVAQVPTSLHWLSNRRPSLISSFLQESFTM